jgi:predicted DsbA family dithiol-disulfide isomerase
MRVAVISDVVCPWCRIGKANLMAAAGRWTAETGEAVEVRMLPFLLDPIEPGVREGFRERFLKRKGIPEAQMTTMFDRVTQVGAAQGIRFDFDKVEVAVDTVPAHELMELVPEAMRLDLMDGLMEAYFEQGKDVGDPDVILPLAKRVGLTDEQAAAIEPRLRAREMEGPVRAMITQVQQAGVSGVPFFIIDDAVGLSGAQPVDVFLQAFAQARQAQAAGAPQG